MEMHALLDEISALLQKIKAGNATLGELEAFAAATQQLNERAIILRYKALEAQVFGTEKKAIVEEPKVEEQIVAEEKVVEPKAEEVEEDLSFDLFSLEEETPVETSTNTPSAEEEVESSLREPQATNEVSFESAPDFFEEPETPVFEAPKEELPVVSEPVQETTISNEHPILKKARVNDGTMQSRLLAVRLETLKGAFGLNERLLIIQELFGGNNEAYIAAIEELDNQAEINVARNKVSAMAHHYGWNSESELAVEFVQKVERRYV